MKRFRLTSVILICLIAVCMAAIPAHADGWDLVFDDEFDGTAVDTAHWQEWPWSCNRYNHCTPVPPTVHDGAVDFETRYTSGRWTISNPLSTGGCINSKTNGMLAARGITCRWINGNIPMLFGFRYGRAEARIKTDGTQWSAFWAKGNTLADTRTTTSWLPEVDIQETCTWAGCSKDTTTSNVHLWRTANAVDTEANHRTIRTTLDRYGRPLDTGWHTYGLEWTPSLMTFTIDGVPSARVNLDDANFNRYVWTGGAADMAGTGAAALRNPLYLIINGGVNIGRAADPSRYADGVHTYVDWVRVWSDPAQAGSRVWHTPEDQGWPDALTAPRLPAGGVDVPADPTLALTGGGVSRTPSGWHVTPTPGGRVTMTRTPTDQTGIAWTATRKEDDVPVIPPVTGGDVRPLRACLPALVVGVVVALAAALIYAHRRPA